MPGPAEIRFDGWTLRRQSGELEKNGARIRLQDHPLQLLDELLANPGQLVSREQLIARLWPKGVVDFDTALNSTVRRLRAALHDEADTPRYIETIPRRGYRFIGTLDVPIAARAPTASPIPARVSDPVTVSAAKSPGWWHTRVVAGSLVVLGLALIAGIGAFLWNARHQEAAGVSEAGSPQTTVTSIAVLPFVNLSPEQDQQYFSDGLSEEVLNLLAQIPTLRVIARTSSFSFRGQDVDIATVARRLNVTHVLEGSVRKSGNRVRITAQLIETATSTHLWSQTYERTLEDPFDVQSDIASSVAKALRVALVNDGAAGAAAVSTNAQAYELFLRARFFIQRRASGDIARAGEYYERALALDPRLPQAWAGLASVHWLQFVQNAAPRATELPQLREAAERALALDPRVAEAHIRLANYSWFTGDRAAGDEHLRQAAELEPNSSLVLSFLASEAARNGRFGEAIELQRRAIETDPLWVASHLNMGNWLYMAGRMSEARTQAQSVMELDPTHTPDLMLRVLIIERQFEEALSLSEAMPEGFARHRFLALVYHGLGREGDADSALQKMIETSEGNDPTLIAEVYAYRGDVDEAFKWLYATQAPEHQGSLRSYWPARYSPFLKTLHADRRWNTWVASIA